MSFPVEYYTATEAVVRALDSAHGEPDRGFRGALARTKFTGPLGLVRLDANRQLVATTQVVTLGAGAPRMIRTVTDIDQAFGGIFRTNGPPPGPDTPACVHTKPPRWAVSRATR
jgi:hypothetical protein